MKALLKFITWFILSFGIIEIIEYIIDIYFSVDIYQLKFAWLLFIFIYGFKFHIICCLLPFIIASYKCKKHNKCKHKHCKN